MKTLALLTIWSAACLAACSGGRTPELPPPAPEAGRDSPEPEPERAATSDESAGPGFLPAQIADVSPVGSDGTVRISLLVDAGDDAHLRDKPYLHIFVGQTEGQALFRAMHGFETPRPMTHNLLASLVRGLDGVVQRVAITDMADGVFIGRIVVRTTDGSETAIDSRPSDALPLAVLFSAPIYVAEDVMRKGGSPSPPDDYEEEDIRFEPEPPRLWHSV